MATSTPFQTQQLDYNTWLGNNSQAQGVVSQDTYNQALQTYGYMPAGRLAPDGSMFWNSTVAETLGLPGGTKLSTMGTSYSQPGTAFDPSSGSGSIYVPQEVQQAATRQGWTGPASAQVIGDYYNNAGVIGAMSSQNPLDYGYQTGGYQVPGMLNTGQSPLRSRTNAITQNPPNPVGTPNQSVVSDFMTWFNNQGPRAEGPLGTQLNFPQAREFQNQYGNWAVMPGQIGTTYNADLMRDNPGIFGAQIQSQQLLQGDPMYGNTLHGFVPPWIAASAGLDGSNYLMGDWPASPYLYGDNGVPHGIDPSVPPASYYPSGGGYGQGAGSGAGTGGANPNPFPSGGGSGGSGGSGSGSSSGGSTGGGGSTNPSLPGSPSTPNYSGANPTDPTGGGVTSDSFFPQGSPSSASEWLAAGANDLSYLQGFAQDGQAINQMPAWQAMVDAQQRNMDRRYADLMESFNVSGNRVSTPFGQAAVDFQTQAGLDQNALLSQMTAQALEQAMGRQYGAANTLGQMANQGISQLSGQDFQNDMWQMNHLYNLASQMYGGSVQGANALNSQAMQAANQLYGTETGAGQNEIQRQMALLQLGLGGANDLSRLWMQNLGLGSALGQQQYGIGQNEIDRIYQEWLRSRAYNSPLLPYMYSAATNYPVSAYPQYQQSQWPSLLGGLAGPLQSILGGLFNSGGNSGGGGNGYFMT